MTGLSMLPSNTPEDEAFEKLANDVADAPGEQTMKHSMRRATMSLACNEVLSVTHTATATSGTAFFNRYRVSRLCGPICPGLIRCSCPAPTDSSRAMPGWLHLSLYSTRAGSNPSKHG